MAKNDTSGLVHENAANDSPIPTTAHTRVCLQTHTTEEIAGSNSARHLLPPFEYNPDLFDNQVDHLIDNLARLKHDARRTFMHRQ